MGDQVEDASRTILFARESPGAIDGLRDVGNLPIAPQANLVAEDFKSACPATPDSASGNDAPPLPAQV